jgi:choline dehydrogenase-like flavoprotein
MSQAGRIIEAQTLTSDLEMDCDVCVIGSGPGGAVSAYTLAKAGHHVVIVEEGGYFTKARFRQREDEAYPYLYQDGGARSVADLSMTILQGKAFGGGSVVNWTTCFRTPTDVLAHWATHHQVGGITEQQLNPHWDVVEQRLSIAPVPLEVVNRNNRTLLDGCKALGKEAELLKRNVRGCAHTGSCGHGCPIDAKQSMLVTYLPDAVALGAVAVTRCRVDRLVYAGQQVVAVEGSALDAFGLSTTGVRIRLKPKRVVLAAGAINSPALLLRSGTDDPHQRLGVRTFLHPVIASVGEYEQPIDGFRGAPQSVASHAFAHRGDEVGYFLEAAPMHPMLAATAAPGFGADHQAFLQKLPYLSGHIAICIDGFHDDVPGGRIRIDSDGCPIVDYVIAPRVWRAFRDAQKNLARIDFAAGAKAVMTVHDPAHRMTSVNDVDSIDQLPYEPGRLGVFSAHQMGGCGMSDDATKGVVRSEDLRHHQVENLHVIDGSVFPTSLGVNPQLTIYGIASLVASRLA